MLAVLCQVLARPDGDESCRHERNTKHRDEQPHG
jgi:hypothetical protein